MKRGKLYRCICVCITAVRKYKVLLSLIYYRACNEIFLIQALAVLRNINFHPRPKTFFTIDQF